MLRKRSSIDDPEEVILVALGVQEPSWRREWTSESSLVEAVRDARTVVRVLSKLTKTRGVDLRERRTESGRHWLLARFARDQNESDDVSLVDGGAEAPRETWPHSDRIGAPTPGPAAGENAGTSVGRPFLARTRERSTPQLNFASGTWSAVGPETQPDLLWRVLVKAGIPVVEIDPHVQVGPSVRRFKVLLEGGAKFEALRRRTEDIARDIGNEVMVSWLPGERYVALDLPRSDRQVVPFGPALEALRSHEGKDGLRIPLGVTPEGESVVIDLCVQPHIAIAGATGSGKTMLMVTSLAALVSQLSPEQVEVLIIDPKALDFVPFASLPHVRGGHIITEPEEAIDALIDLTEHELPRRTQLLQDAGCSSLRDLRARRPDLAVKYIVVAIDEYADLVAVLGKAARPAFERQILRLTQRARAIGIHIILATQRPSTEFVTGAVKSNLPTRIAFRLPQRIDSMVILDQPGAERLLGSGDMLLSRDGRIQRIQGYFASMEESASLMAERIAELKGGR